MTVQRVSLVTLGVSDLARSRAFYEGWGWTVRQESPQIVFFQMDGLVLALFGAEDLAQDQGRAGAALGTGAITLAQNYASTEEVEERFAAALAVGGRALKRPESMQWGGYSGYVCDPDGHVWELAVNPFWVTGEHGTVIPDDLPTS
ncbi:VOC family protein [Demequina globuliformis]|uniref:VOC family protein n=1 Tax=Demequina globuliformis TaxID=676202 RepID=UPI000780E97C|nr:VOC family protein [Demequina globuliformis]